MPSLPILLVPGLNCTERAFVDLLPTLWPLGSVTIANHRRGDTVETIASAILAEAPRRFALCGFSMGGYIAFEMLRQAPERVDRVCFLATSARPDDDAKRSDRLRQIALAEAGRFDAVVGANYENAVHPDNHANAAIRALHRQMALDTGPQTYIAQQRAVMARPDSRPDLKNIAVPASVIVGEADTVTGVDAAEEIAAGIGGARFTSVAGAGHFAPVEQPAAVGAAMAEWLAD